MSKTSSRDGKVACLAGRRIDAVDANLARFPLRNAAAVKAALISTLARERVTHVVCSAACGADILALEACEKLGIETSVILPFSSDEFRKISVADRPGDWGPRFDRMIESCDANGTLTELDLPPTTADAFEQANIEIVLKAFQIPADEHIALIVWDGAKHGMSDATEDVRDRAIERGFRIVEISTLVDAK